MDFPLDEAIKCNLLLIGFTGAGKSTFANYLFEVDIFKTGRGSPVTKWEDNFQHYSLMISDIQVNVYDSVGLEPTNFDKWMKETEFFLDEKQSLSSANEVIHVGFYLINIASRVESNEIKLIKNISTKYKIPIFVILTHCDDQDKYKTKIKNKEEDIKRNGLESIRVCSKSRTGPDGKKYTPFGRDLALKKLLEASYEKIGRDLTIAAFEQLIDHLYDIKNKLIEKIDQSSISIFNIESSNESINNISEEFDEMLSVLDFIEIRNFLPSSYINYYDFIENFDIEFQGKNIFEEAWDNLNEIGDRIGEREFNNKFEEATNNLESDNIFEKIGAVFELAGLALFSKTKMKECVTEIVDPFINEVKIKLEKFKRSQFNA